MLCGISGSSEALLSGQKPPFMLLVRAYNKVDNTRALHIRNGTSEYFVVSNLAYLIYPQY